MVCERAEVLADWWRIQTGRGSGGKGGGITKAQTVMSAVKNHMDVVESGAYT